MQRQIAISCLILMAITVMAVSSTFADAAPFSQQNYWNQLEEDDPEALLDMLARLRHSIMRNQELENNKRGLDLGLSRGFSGSQAAKHLMGLAAANYAGGPGRRRRSE
ncbi:diuretic hormone class 2 [Polistes fuscatus]|uniref:diuretic hormone class 2 n=1 Tax=Polistes fuscatus TaxID=30207 RepID=UPI001CA84237|nr:diuretic hormone class 2 [Polistes fuscatus]